MIILLVFTVIVLIIIICGLTVYNTILDGKNKQLESDCRTLRNILL